MKIMNDEIITGVICIDTDDAYMKIGPFTFEDTLNDTYIKNKIHETLLKNGYEYYTAEDVEDIVVVFEADGFGGVYSPKIEDVWPKDFGPKGFKRYVTKRGDK